MDAAVFTLSNSGEATPAPTTASPTARTPAMGAAMTMNTRAPRLQRGATRAGRDTGTPQWQRGRHRELNTKQGSIEIHSRKVTASNCQLLIHSLRKTVPIQNGKKSARCGTKSYTTGDQELSRKTKQQSPPLGPQAQQRTPCSSPRNRNPARSCPLTKHGLGHRLRLTGTLWQLHMHL